MAKTIEQAVVFKGVSPKRLFDMYLDSRLHAAVIGDKVAISRKVGAKFSAFGGSITGRNLAIVPGRMIVQAWRSDGWKKTDPDSILILTFGPAPGGAQIGLVHALVPDYDRTGVTEGWREYYWKPWKAFLGAR